MVRTSLAVEITKGPTRGIADRMSQDSNGIEATLTINMLRHQKPSSTISIVIFSPPLTRILSPSLCVHKRRYSLRSPKIRSPEIILTHSNLTNYF